MQDKIIVVLEEISTSCPHGLGYMFFERMQYFKNNVAQIDVSNGYEDTYSKLLQRCIRTSLELKARGVTKEDIIVLNTNNHLDSYVPFVAALFLGCRVASLDPSIPLDDARYLLAQVCPKIIFTISSSEEIMTEAIDTLTTKPEIIVFGTEGFEKFIHPKDEEYTFDVVKVDPNETAVILFSSGTTGLPKGICCNHLLLTKAGNIFLDGLDNRRILYYSTLYWISAVTLLITSCQFGYTRLLVAKFDPSEFWSIVAKYKCTSFFCAPTQIVQIVKNKPQQKIAITDLKSIIVGGGPAPIDYINDFVKIYPHITISQVWGQTELGMVTKFQHNDPKQMELLQENPSSCGMLISGYAAKIVDPDTNIILGPNQIGEIRIKSIYQMNGYHNKDSIDAWDAEGYICTGDLGYYNDDKCFFIVDRLKEMLKYRSWHVTPAKIESVLLSHPSVSEAVVIGKPDVEDGDHPLALIVLKQPDALSTTPKDIKLYCNKQMDDRHKLRGGVIFVNKLLHTASGKLKRAEMRRLILSGNKSF